MVEGRQASRTRTVIELPVYAAYTINVYSLSIIYTYIYNVLYMCVCVCIISLPSWLSGKESAGHAEDSGLICGLGRSPGERSGNRLQYSCLGNPMGATIHGVAKSWT